MQARLTDINRKLENMLRLGTIAEVKQNYCRVKTGNLTLDWRPYCTTRAGTAKTSWRPSVGEQVIIFAPGGDLHGALIGPAFYSAHNDQPDEHQSRHYVEYPDGAVISYDPDTGELSASGIQKATIVAGSKVTVDCPETEITGNVTINGQLTVAGLSKLDGDAVIKDIRFSTHKHPSDSGGKTGEPE